MFSGLWQEFLVVIHGPHRPAHEDLRAPRASEVLVISNIEPTQVCRPEECES